MNGAALALTDGGAPRAPRAVDAGLGAPALAIGIAVDLALWALVSVEQSTVSIFAVHAAMLLGCVLLVRVWFKSALPIFVTALLLRSAFTVAAWYFAFNEERKFFVGTNADSSRFWEAASLSYDDAILAFEDPLFPRLNVFLDRVSNAIGDPSYLANTQAVMFAGTLMVVFSYLLVRDLYGPKVGRLTGYLMAANPIAIAFSTGLMRDSLIGMFGFVFLYCLNRTLISKRLTARLALVFWMLVAGVALANLRTISLGGFVLAGFLLFMSRTPRRPNVLSKTARWSIVATLIAIAGLAAADRFDRVEGLLDYAIMVRAGDSTADGGELNPDGITTRIAAVSPALFGLISPIVLMQPLPFYTWDAPVFVGGPPALIDVLIGFGGLFNQILFGFYIVAVRHWLKTRDSVGLWVGVGFTLLMCTITLVGLGQIRMVMEHCYAFFFAGIGLAVFEALRASPRLVAKTLLTWAATLVALYLGYASYREWDSRLLAALFTVLAVLGLRALWRSGDAPPRRLLVQPLK